MAEKLKPEQKPENFLRLDEVYGKILAALEQKKEKPLVKLLLQLHPSDLADLLERLPLELRDEVVRNIPMDRFGDVISEASDGVQERLVSEVTPQDLGEALEGMESADVVDIVQQLEADVAGEVSEQLDLEAKELLSYAEDTAGGLMRARYAHVLKTWSVERVLDYLRDESSNLPENIDDIYVTSREGKLRGSVTLSRLVKLPLHKKIRSVMWENPVSVNPEMDQEEVARLFEKYDIHSCPVINAKGEILGVIRIDDIIDVIAQEHEQDIMRAAGLIEGGDLFAPVHQTTRQRFPWLFINLLTAVLASIVIAFFEDEIARLVVLAVLMPIVASMGGNAGTQTMTVAVRGLAMGQLTFQNALSLLKKELLVGGFNGILLALLLGVGVVFIYNDLALGVVICVATIVNHILAAFAGMLIPLYLEHSGKDPAVSSGVLLTTVTDVGGFFIFLGLSAVFLV